MDYSTLYKYRASSIWYQKNLELRKHLFKAKIIPKLKEWKIFESHTKMVDIGCGQGDKSDIISRNLKNNSSLISLELSQHMINSAKKRYPRLGDKIIRDDALLLSKLKGLYDVMFYIQILQHFTHKQIETAISKAIQFLTPNGKIITINTYKPEKGILNKYFSLSQYWYERLFKIQSGSYKNLTVSDMCNIFTKFGLIMTGRYSAGCIIQVLCFQKK